MVVVSIIGVLSAVALPAFTDAQNVGKGNAAKQQSVQSAKGCQIALTKGDSTLGNTTASATGDAVTHTATTCSDTAAFAYTSGGETWTTTLVGGVPGKPVKS